MKNFIFHLFLFPLISMDKRVAFDDRTSHRTNRGEMKSCYARKKFSIRVFPRSWNARSPRIPILSSIPEGFVVAE